MSELEEIKQAVETANDGNWIPFTVVLGCLLVVVTLFVYILKLKETNFTESLKKSDDNINKLTDIQISMDKMLAVHDNEIKAHEKEINHLKESA